MTSATMLSRNDTAVLGALFDPEASLDKGINIDNLLEDAYDKTTMADIRQAEKEALSSINSQFPLERDIRRTISQLTTIVKQYPKYASAWNNRAQAKRLLAPYENPDCICGVFDDLGKAIHLASPIVPTNPVSIADAKVLASAHTHRGYLIWRASRSISFRNSLDGVQQLDGLSEMELEELASRDFATGGRYGNKTAQTLAVKTNPYAKLCGSIVREALQKEISDYGKVQSPGES